MQFDRLVKTLLENTTVPSVNQTIEIQNENKLLEFIKNNTKHSLDFYEENYPKTKPSPELKEKMLASYVDFPRDFSTGLQYQLNRALGFPEKCHITIRLGDMHEVRHQYFPPSIIIHFIGFEIFSMEGLLKGVLKYGQDIKNQSVIDTITKSLENPPMALRPVSGTYKWEDIGNMIATSSKNEKPFESLYGFSSRQYDIASYITDKAHVIIEKKKFTLNDIPEAAYDLLERQKIGHEIQIKELKDFLTNITKYKFEDSIRNWEKIKDIF